jgi:ubiquinone/menaquinone biosynthesis C-methylase UbiE
MMSSLARWVRWVWPERPPQTTAPSQRASSTPAPVEAGELASLVPVRAVRKMPRAALDKSQRALARRDAWFYGHFSEAAGAIMHSLALDKLPDDARILDLGCGDGIMAFGVCEASGRQVVGTDLTEAFKILPARAQQTLGRTSLPTRLHFVRGELNCALPFPDAHFTAGYSWSVFEHVTSLGSLTQELYRVLRADGRFFLRVAPLFHSRWGSHLRRLVHTPWAHLLMSEADFLEQAASAPDQRRNGTRSTNADPNEFEDVKRYLISEYKALNHLTTIELVRAILDAGFVIEDCALGQDHSEPPPQELTERYSIHDLLTHEIQLTLRKPAQPN